MARRSHLTKADLAGFRKMLVEKRNVALRDVEALKEQLAEEQNAETPGGGLSDLPTHLADVGTDAYEREFLQKLILSREELLLQIDEALDRLDRGAYGVCLATGRPISKARLRVEPWARYSADYARQLEHA